MRRVRGVGGGFRIVISRYRGGLVIGACRGFSSISGVEGICVFGRVVDFVWGVVRLGRL